MVKPEDRNLAPGQFHALNETFYRGAPQEYFSRRLISLYFATADSPKVREATQEGLRFGRMQMQGDLEPYDEKASERYAVLESVNLLHHASEVLMRLYFAHADLQPCPWLEVARLRLPRQFRESLEVFLAGISNQDTKRAITTVFRGGNEPAALGVPGTQEQWESEAEGIIALVQDLAARLLREAPMYNSAKHGLSLVGADIAARLDADGLPLEIDLANRGPSLTYLEVVDRGQGRYWTETLTWVQADSYLGLTQLVVRALDALWTVARWRYLGADAELPALIDPELVRELSTGHWQRPVHVPGMSVNLLYEAEEPPGAL